MTDRFALTTWRSSTSGAHQGRVGRARQGGDGDPAARRGRRPAPQGGQHVQGSLSRSTQERTPSFTVSPARGTFKCFGCGEGGDAITFVEKTENVDFVGAIELLARRFGVELEYEESSPEQEQKRRARIGCARCSSARPSSTRASSGSREAGAGAREYLASRGLGEEVCREFRLGYAPGGGRLAARALQEGYTQEELLAVGLANRRGNDYFQRRIVFPLADARGRVRGFQARKLHDDDPLQAKYVNSPEGELFRKGDLLYGLDTARQAIAKEDRAVIVEGNTDVLALRQAGFAPVVASMGTALTEAPAARARAADEAALPLLRLRRRRAGRDAARDGARGARRASPCASCRCRRARIRPTIRRRSSSSSRAPVSYPVHRVRLEHARATDRRAAFAAIRAFLTSLPDSPEHLEAGRLAADLLDLPPETQAALAPRARERAYRGRRLAAAARRRAAARAQRPRRRRGARVAAAPSSSELGPEHFDDELHRRARAYLLGQEPRTAS